MAWTRYINYNGGQYKVNDNGQWIAQKNGNVQRGWASNKTFATRAAELWIDNLI